MQRITGKEEIGNCLLLLTFFSMQFMNEVMSKEMNRSFMSDNLSSFLSIQNIFLILIPILIYLAFKGYGLFLKIIYLLSTIPILFTSSIFDILNIKLLYFFNIAIIFVLIVCLIKYINQIFESYKAIYLENSGLSGHPLKL